MVPGIFSPPPGVFFRIDGSWGLQMHVSTESTSHRIPQKKKNNSGPQYRPASQLLCLRGRKGNGRWAKVHIKPSLTFFQCRPGPDGVWVFRWPADEAPIRTMCIARIVRAPLSCKIVPGALGEIHDVGMCTDKYSWIGFPLSTTLAAQHWLILAL